MTGALKYITIFGIGTGLVASFTFFTLRVIDQNIIDARRSAFIESVARTPLYVAAELENIVSAPQNMVEQMEDTWQR